MVMIIGLLETFIALFFFLLIQCFLLHKKTKKHLLTNWPVLGMVPGLIPQVPRVYDWITEALEASNMTYYLKGPWFTGTDILLTADPLNVHYILSSNFDNYPKGEEFQEIFEVFGEGIFNADSGLWEDMRSATHALFSDTDFQKFSVSTSVSKLKQGLVPILENAAEKKIVVNLQDLFQRFLFDTSAILMMGFDPKCISFEMPKFEVGDVVDGAADGLFYRHVKPYFLWKLQYWIGVGIEKNMRRGFEVSDRLLGEVISARREENKTYGTHQGGALDVLSYYMTVDTNKYKHLKPSDNKFLRDSLLNLIVAGRDTTASGLTWLFWLLSKNPEVVTKIRQEINNKMPDSDPENLDKLVYLHGAVSESLRLYPPIPFNHKSTAKPDVLPSGHKVDKNCKIVIPIYALGRMTSVWGDDADDFKPERWISQNGTLRHEPTYKFLAFNAGPRSCLGKSLAFLQIKRVTVEIIRNYDIKVVEGHKPSPVPSITLRMQHGLEVTVTKI